MANGLLANDVLLWKAIGAAVWAAAIAVAASGALGLMLSPATLFSPARLVGGSFSLSAWLSATALVLAQAPAFAGAAAALRACEPRPAHLHRLLHWPRCAPASMLIGKLAARLGSVADAASTAAFFATHALSAALFLSVFAAAMGNAMGGARSTLQYSLWLATAYLLHWVHCSQDVLAFPSVQRHRYFRMKQRLPRAAVQAAQLAAAAFSCAVTTSLLRSNVLGEASPGASGAPLTLGGGTAALLAGALCTFCWLMSSAALEVVFTERLRPDDYSDRDVLRAMVACLAGKRGGLMQGLALHDASLLAGDVGRAALRRADMFADESGDRWKPVAVACIAELDAVSAAVGAALQQQKPAGGAAGMPSAATQSHKWNVLPSSLSSKGGLGSSKQQLDALLAVRCGYPRAAQAAQALAGFACASLKEDRFGVLQLTQPGLGDVLLCLLGALGATQQLMRVTASLVPRQLSLGPWRGNGDAAAWAGCYSSPSVDAAAYALQDTLTVALYRTSTTFGAGLGKVLADCTGKPAYGSASEAAALLQQFQRGQA